MPCRSDSRVQWFIGNAAANDIGKEVGEATGRELIFGRLDFIYRPPAMLSHEVALEIIPAADIDVVTIDAHEVKALALAQNPAAVRKWKSMFTHPDKRTDLTGNEPALFSQLSPQGAGIGFSIRHAAARRDPKITRSALVAEGFEQQDAVVTI